MRMHNGQTACGGRAECLMRSHVKYESHATNGNYISFVVLRLRHALWSAVAVGYAAAAAAVSCRRY